MDKYSQGVCENGAAILENGQMMTIDDILEGLRIPGIIQANIIQAMKDLCKNADDTVWITGTETMFDRLAQLHLSAGGSREDMAEIWPEYFGGL